MITSIYNNVFENTKNKKVYNFLNSEKVRNIVLLDNKYWYFEYYNIGQENIAKDIFKSISRQLEKKGYIYLFNNISI